MNSYTVHVFTAPYTYLAEHVLIAASGISLTKKSDKIPKLRWDLHLSFVSFFNSSKKWFNKFSMKTVCLVFEYDSSIAVPPKIVSHLSFRDCFIKNENFKKSWKFQFKLKMYCNSSEHAVYIWNGKLQFPIKGVNWRH